MPKPPEQITSPAPWRIYTDAEIEKARKVTKARFKIDLTDYELIWFLRDQHEPGWRARADKPADKLVACLGGWTFPANRKKEPSNVV